MKHSNSFNENLKLGWISLYRSAREHWLYPHNKKLTDWEAWIEILFQVNHNAEKCRIGNIIVECNRGEKLYSLDTWAKLFGWNKSKVRRFFNLLEKEKMIAIKSEYKTTRLIVCNYAYYQDRPTRLRHGEDTMATPIKKLNKKNNNSTSSHKNEEQNESYYMTKRKRILRGKELKRFNTFWENFDYKKNKSEAADEWIDIPNLTEDLAERIYQSAKSESKLRPDLEISGKTPKMASGWLAARRWEDDYEPTQKFKKSTQWLT